MTNKKQTILGSPPKQMAIVAAFAAVYDTLMNWILGTIALACFGILYPHYRQRRHIFKKIGTTNPHQLRLEFMFIATGSILLLQLDIGLINGVYHASLSVMAGVSSIAFVSAGDIRVSKKAIHFCEKKSKTYWQIMIYSNIFSPFV